jgi:hypothetical protein
VKYSTVNYLRSTICSLLQELRRSQIVSRVPPERKKMLTMTEINLLALTMMKRKPKRLLLRRMMTVRTNTWRRLSIVRITLR